MKFRSIGLSALLLLCSVIATAYTPLWLRYPSISPDGEMVAFSHRGDLWIVSADGGNARQLTTHPGYDYMPVWSNDGSKIAFASERYGNIDIFVMPTEGGKARRLTYHSGTDKPYCFSADDKQVLFGAQRQDPASSAMFPTRVLPELYAVPVDGGRVDMVLGTPAEFVQWNDEGTRLLYHDKKGYEDVLRKHHTSSVTRDVWVYNATDGTHTKLTSFNGEDRNPVWAGTEAYYLSEKSGSYNVWKLNIEDPSSPEQVTSFTKHPVRFLSRSNSGKLCFGFDGEIYTLMGEGEPQKLTIDIIADENYSDIVYEKIKGGIHEIALSPNGKEIAFVYRGEVFVTSTGHTDTKQITHTPEQERSVSFSPDGRSLIYAGERDGSWNIYQATIKRDEEKYFHLSTLIEEEPIVVSEKATFQPQYSPNGEEVAFLEERTRIKVINLKSKKQREILPKNRNYSYTDGDQWFQWSPDGKWIAAQMIDNNRWSNDLGLIAADGKSDPINLTQSGYDEAHPVWMAKGNILMYYTDRHGRRAHASWGADMDVFGMFMNQEYFDKFNLRKSEYEAMKEEEKKEQKEDQGESDDKEETEEVEEIRIDLDNIEDRKVRLTIHSSRLSDAVITPDGEKLFYLSRFEKGYDLWMHDFREDKTTLVAKLNGRSSQLQMDKKGETLYFLDGGKIFKVSIKGGDKNGKTAKKPVPFSAMMKLDRQAEREYIYYHAWRQTKKKFYLPDMHGVDWPFYRDAYAKFLPHINNGYDFADLLSELLGELNASHTGGRYRPHHEAGDQTASLGVIYDWNYEGDGLKIAEVLPKSPVISADSKIKDGVIIESINGHEIKSNTNIAEQLNHLQGKLTLLKLYDPSEKERWEETVRPISLGKENGLRYERWVEKNQQYIEEKTNGKYGYVHVRGMNEASYREVYEDLLGKYNDTKGVIVDTRFNGGGWLHDDLATLLSGKLYMTFSPRGQENMGGEPIWKYHGSSVVIMSEGNYSDAHMFPYTYRALGIGKLVGMPVPGTGTAVWWELQIDGETIFGIPQVGMKGPDGKLLENQLLEPDVKVALDPETVVDGDDKQLDKALEVLMN